MSNVNSHSLVMKVVLYLSTHPLQRDKGLSPGGGGGGGGGRGERGGGGGTMGITMPLLKNPHAQRQNH